MVLRKTIYKTKTYFIMETKAITLDDYLKACRAGSREAEMDNSCGWVAKHKVHQSKKHYKRKSKHKTKY